MRVWARCQTGLGFGRVRIRTYGRGHGMPLLNLSIDAAKAALAICLNALRVTRDCDFVVDRLFQIIPRFTSPSDPPFLLPRRNMYR